MKRSLIVFLFLWLFISSCSESKKITKSTVAPTLVATEITPTETVGDHEKLIVERVSPVNGSENIPLNTPIMIFFNTTVEYEVGYLVVNPDIEIFVEDSGNLLDITPRYGWKPSTTYKFNLLKGLKDKEGRELEEEYSFSFTTVVINNATEVINKEYFELQKVLQEKAGNYSVSGKFTFAVTDLQSNQTIGLSENERVLSGCTMNFFVLFAIVGELQRGSLLFGEVDLLISETIRSSNASTAYTLYRILGKGDALEGVRKVDLLMKDLGLKDSQIDHPPAFIESLGIDSDNWITASDANLALRKLYAGETLNPFWTEYLLKRMTGVKAGLNYLTGYGTGGVVSHKNGFFPYSGGWVDNDLGIVRFERNGREFAYAISFFSSEVGTKYADIPLGQDISVTVWNYFDQKYR